MTPDPRLERALEPRAEPLVGVAEELAEERVVGERRVRRAHDGHRREVDDAADGAAGHGAEVGEALARDAGPAAARRGAPAGAAGARRLGGGALGRRVACGRSDTRPATKPASTSRMRERSSSQHGRGRRWLRLLDVDAAPAGHLGDRDREDAVLQVGRDGGGVDGGGQGERAREAAVAALDPIEPHRPGVAVGRSPWSVSLPSWTVIWMSSRVRPGTSAVIMKWSGVSDRSTGGIQPASSAPARRFNRSWSASRSCSGSQRVEATSHRSMSPPAADPANPCAKINGWLQRFFRRQVRSCKRHDCAREC